MKKIKEKKGFEKMPMRKELYPKNWKEIAFQIKEKAYWKCNQCGKQCRKPGEPFDTHKRTLTVSHLNHIPQDIREENLKAMCAPCHLRYDSNHHIETRRKNNRKEKVYEKKEKKIP